MPGLGGCDESGKVLGAQCQRGTCVLRGWQASHIYSQAQKGFLEEGVFRQTGRNKALLSLKTVFSSEVIQL